MFMDRPNRPALVAGSMNEYFAIQAFLGAACTSMNPIYNLAHGHLSITIIDYHWRPKWG
jgi:hypothetical protein